MFEEVMHTIIVFILGGAGFVLACCVFLAVISYCTNVLLPSIPFVRRFLNSLPLVTEDRERREREEEKARRARIRQYRLEMMEQTRVSKDNANKMAENH